MANYGIERTDIDLHTVLMEIIVADAVAQTAAISFEIRCDETINIELYCTFVVKTLESRTMMIVL